MDIAAIYQLYKQHPVVTTDTRNCPPGSIFIALKGDNFNGNAFALQALEKGCAYAVVDEAKYAVNDKIIRVKNSLQTLQQLANYHRKQLDTTVIGITGTNGKTTTKELIAAVLSKKYNILFTQGNLNNHIGVPLTLLNLTAKHEIAVIEMGASHPGDIKELAYIAEPDYGLITNVGKAHLEGFKSLEGVIHTKGELFDYLRNKKRAAVFINNDNSYLTEIAKGLNLIPYGGKDDLYINGKTISCSPFLSFSWKTGKDGETHQVQTKLIGDYNLDNTLAAVTIGHYFDVDAELIDQALENYIPQNNRSQLKDTGKNKLIIDAYNANPTSMTAALQNFNQMEAERKMLILGEMKELGESSEEEHQKIIQYLNQCDVDKVILVGEQFKKIPSPYISVDNTLEAVEILKKEKPEGYYILIKGSNSVKLQGVVDYL